MKIKHINPFLYSQFEKVQIIMSENNLIASHPLRYSLGESSERVIILQDEGMCVTHEYLHQTTISTRSYQYQTDTFCFVIKGSVNLKRNHQETTLKEHQGIWLKAKTQNTATLLSPRAELCFIKFKGCYSSEKSPLHKVSPGKIKAVTGKNHTKSWTLWQDKLGKISLELYPPGYIEPLYYQKEATQYILPLNGKVAVSNKQTKFKDCGSLGQVFFKKTVRSLSNPNTTSAVVLSITNQPSSKGRVLVLQSP